MPSHRLLLTSLLALLPAASSAQPLLSAARWLSVSPPGAMSMKMDRGASGPQGTLGVISVTVSRAVDPFYGSQVLQPIAAAVPSGHRLRLTFRARSETRNPMRVVVEKTTAPYTAVAEVLPYLTPEWKRYSTVGASPGFGPGGLSVRFQVGHQAGEIEIADVALNDIGPDPDMVAAAEAVRPAAIQARIRRYRMGTLRVVATRGGKAVPGATVSVEQKRHAFLFGCNIFELDPASTEPWQKQYQERYCALFNYATLPFYWGGFEGERGKPQYAKLDAMARWCRDHGIITKGHPLVWHEVYPSWAPKDPDEAIPLLHQRVTAIIRHYGGLIHYWDVLNEANGAAAYAQTGEGAWIKRDGPSKVVATALGWARAASHGLTNTLIYNDYNTSEPNVELLTALRQANALPDAIGIQSHMHSGPWPIEQVWATAQRFSRFGRPIHFTETTVISGPSRQIDNNHPPTDWNTTPEDEANQADYLARFYAVLFSHPAVRAITYWDFADRNAWLNAPAGFLRKDMSPKPVYNRLLKLVKHDWWTRVRGATDSAGRYETPAFYGDYRITVRGPSGRTITRTVAFPTASGMRAVRVQLP